MYAAPLKIRPTRPRPMHVRRDINNNTGTSIARIMVVRARRVARYAKRRARVYTPLRRSSGLRARARI